MDDAKQNWDTTVPNTGNVMNRVLETFDRLADNAIAPIGPGVPKVGTAVPSLAEKAGALAGNILDRIFDDSQSLGKTIGGIAGSISSKSFSQGVDPFVSFARGFYGRLMAGQALVSLGL